MFSSILLFIHVFVCIIIIGLVLLQQGKGASLGASFGGGGDSFFGAAGADNILTKITTVCAVIFMTTSVTLAASNRATWAASGSGGLLDVLPAATPAPESQPSADVSPTPEATPAEAVPGEDSKGEAEGASDQTSPFPAVADGDKATGAEAVPAPSAGGDVKEGKPSETQQGAVGVVPPPAPVNVINVEPGVKIPAKAAEGTNSATKP